MLLPALLFILVFSYLPMYGIVLAFKTFAFNRPSALGDLPVLRYIGQIMNMEWAGFKWFYLLVSKPDFWNAFKNTITISLGRLLFEFPMPIILALMLNEMRLPKFKQIYQTAYTFPNFLSWVLVVGILSGIFNTTGVINQALVAGGGQPVPFLQNPLIFRVLLHVTNIWKGAGWGSIIYLAAIAGIDPSLYEAAIVDGAHRGHCLWHITLPSIKPTIVIMLILACGGILNAGFDQIFNFYNTAVLSSSDIIDTWIYRYAFQDGARNYSMTVATGMFKAVCNFILLLSANQIAKFIGEEGLL